MIALPMSPASWRIKYSPGMPKHPTAAAPGWRFDFPAHPHSVGYVNIHKPLDLTQFTMMTMTFEITGDTPVFVPEGSGDIPPCALHLWFQRAGDDGTATDSDYRWWSNPLFFDLKLTPSYSLQVPLDAANWTNVLGKSGTERPSGFLAARKKMANIGMTFGGHYFFGHGASLSSGRASFNCTSYVCS